MRNSDKEYIFAGHKLLFRVIKPHIVDQIISTARVEDIIDDYVNLNRRGTNLVGLCPFHDEKTPSFSVSPAKNIYKCFGCGKAGDSITFLMEHEHFTFPEALRHLAQRYNIEIEEEERSDEQKELQQKKDSLLLINEMAAKYFTSQLKETEEGQTIGLSYFKHRGLLSHTIDTFGLGYSAQSYDAFKAYALNLGYKEKLLQQLGLISASGNDFFRERVIFPFHNLSGKVIGFGGRILKDNVKAPKYLNSPESEIYNKRKTLYGLYQAKGAIRQSDSCILVEGYTDVLSLYQNDIKNVVASSGTSLTPQQVGLIKRFAGNVIVLYDGDTAGQKAAQRGLNIFLEYDINVKIVILPEGHDPDSYIQMIGAQDFKNFITNEGRDFIILLAQDIEQLYSDNPIEKSVQIKELVNSLSLMQDQIKRQLYVKQCAQILHVEESSLFQEINKMIRTRIKKASYKRPKQVPTEYNPPEANIDFDPNADHSQRIRGMGSDNLDYQERDVVRVLISDGDKIHNEEAQESIGLFIIDNLKDIMEMISDPLHKQIFEEYHTLLNNDIVPDRQYWLRHSNQDIRALALSLLSDKYTYAKWSEKGLELQTQKPIEENYIKDSHQALLRYKLKKVKERVQELQRLFDQQEDDKRDIVLLTAFQALIQERQTLANKLKMTVM